MWLGEIERGSSRDTTPSASQLGLANGEISETIGPRLGGSEMTLTHIVEIVIVVVVIFLAVRLFRKRA